jgi:hypothetical protein
MTPTAPATIFHADPPNFSAQAVEVENLKPVAEIEFHVDLGISNALELCFRRTNHIDDSWITRPKNDGTATVMPTVDRARSTSVGDVVKIGEEHYIVSHMGFKLLTNKEGLLVQ